jgi:hypothetical protein
MMGLIELLGRAATALEREAAVLRGCHTVRGKWAADEENVRAKYEELRSLAAGLRRAKKYHEPNPLGGPAKVFDAIADSVRAGDDLDSAMARMGVQWVKNFPTGSARKRLDGGRFS